MTAVMSSKSYHRPYWNMSPNLHYDMWRLQHVSCVKMDQAYLCFSTPTFNLLHSAGTGGGGLGTRLRYTTVHALHLNLGHLTIVLSTFSLCRYSEQCMWSGDSVTWPLPWQRVWEEGTHPSWESMLSPQEREIWTVNTIYCIAIFFVLYLHCTCSIQSCNCIYM